MIGDTNLFFASAEDRVVAEAEIMVAEPSARGQHLGWEAMILMFLYGIHHLHVKQFVVKVSEDNQVSLNMFEKIGFVETSRSQIFKEITLNKVVDDGWLKWLETTAHSYSITSDSNNSAFDSSD